MTIPYWSSISRRLGPTVRYLNQYTQPCNLEILACKSRINQKTLCTLSWTLFHRTGLVGIFSDPFELSADSRQDTQPCHSLSGAVGSLQTLIMNLSFKKCISVLHYGNWLLLGLTFPIMHAAVQVVTDMRDSPCNYKYNPLRSLWTTNYWRIRTKTPINQKLTHANKALDKYVPHSNPRLLSKIFPPRYNLRTPLQLQNYREKKRALVRISWSTTTPSYSGAVSVNVYAAVYTRKTVASEVFTPLNSILYLLKTNPLDQRMWPTSATHRGTTHHK